MSCRATSSWTAIVVLVSLTAGPASAWTSDSHRRVSSIAHDILDESLVPLVRMDWTPMVDSAVQPDLMRPRQFPQLRDREAPEHYLDWELLQGQKLPVTRSEYIKLLARLVHLPEPRVGRAWTMETFGTLPYAVVEGTQRLAVAFAQLRQRPADPTVRAMAMYLAGIVAHYAQDLCQPLHTTVDFDGRARRDGSSPYSGIHKILDGSLRGVSIDREALAAVSSKSFTDLYTSVIEQLETSHDLVERVYALETDIWKLAKTGETSPELEEFLRGRFLHAATFTADLIHTAWALSAEVDVPTWWGDDRSPFPDP